MIERIYVNSLFGAKVVDRDGEKVGTVKQVYLDKDTGDPLFATVPTGFFGTSQSFVPLRDAELVGEELRVGYDKETIKGAPRVDNDGELTDDEQDRLFDYYRSAGLAEDDNDNAGGGNGEGGDTDVAAGGPTSTGVVTPVPTAEPPAVSDQDAADRAAAEQQGAAEQQADAGQPAATAWTADGGTDEPAPTTGRTRLRRHVVTDAQTEFDPNGETVAESRETVTVERSRTGRHVADAPADQSGQGGTD
ncbi:PRC-barrel domain-containing protein [Gryllotalpicola ginsengisoli]|uniref:PRC-barrel domain-containing protein n=1 Tax=Gryllotalpicola ginsengisoli TaxID=444608 RepID=UPI0003B307AF|nr:PRC-barrel domain-containing protein [Gryllotalpicola ginsengisoli]